MNHTPGPWLRNAENGNHIVDIEGYTIADVARAKDAPIIAAAPDLLEVLKQAITVYGELRPESGASINTLDIYQQMLRAIAKAEGRTA